MCTEAAGHSLMSPTPKDGLSAGGRKEGRKDELVASSRRTSSSEFKGSKILVTVSRAILLVCGIRTPLQSAKERAGESSAAPLVNKRNAPALKVVG